MSKRAKRSPKPNPREDRNHSQQRNNPQEERHTISRRKRVDLIPKSLTQEKYIKALENEEQYLVFATGPAGSGKTYMATLYAIKALKEGLVERIIVTRPAVSVDEEHGFLPGTLIDKVAPWCRPVLDVFKEFYSPQQLVKMMEEEVVELSPLGFMRGRTFKNAIIIFDESQNSLPSQMQMLLTRIGEGSRVIVTGDIDQHDRGFEQNGLKDFITKLEERNSKSISVVNFDQTDIQRHPVIDEVLDIYKGVKY